MVLGQGCVWYSGQFWALYFLPTVKKLDVLTSSYIVGIALRIVTPTLMFWGWLSDKIGRKRIILGGMARLAHVLPALHRARKLPGSEERQLPDGHPHRGDPGELRGHDVRADRRLPGGVLPGPHSNSSVSVPYHIGNGWGGALVPIITTSAFLSTGSLGWALANPIILPAVMFLLTVFLMPETRQHSIWEEGAVEAARSRA